MKLYEAGMKHATVWTFG